MTQNQPTKVTIGEKTFEFYHISVRKLTPLFIKLIKIVGVPLSTSISADALKSKNIDGINIEKVVKALAESLDEKAVDSIIDGVLSSAVCLGVGQVLTNQDKIFGNDLVLFWKVVYNALDTYFGSLLREGLGQLK